LECSIISEDNQEYYYEYARTGVLDLEKSWVMLGMKESDQEMVQVLKAIK